MNQIIYAGKHALTLSVSRHTHASWEFIYCTGGSGTMHFDDGEMDYGVHDVVVIPPYVPHSNASTEGFTNVHLNVADAALTQTRPLIVQGDRNLYLLNAFTAAFHYYSNASAEAAALLPVYGQLICTFLALSQPERPCSEPVQRIQDAILHSFPDCTFDLNAYLQTFPFSREYLVRLFKKETGMTPHQFLTERRLESAQRNLAIICDRRNISEIARLSGFSNPLYFSRLFKKRYGVSPRYYVPGPEVPAGRSRP